MIQSMTGYGKAVAQLPSKKITIEIKSLNSKHLDVNVRMPSLYRAKELELRKAIANTLKRGKIELGLYIETTAEQSTTTLNKTVIESYMNQLNAITKANTIELLKLAVKMPDALTTEREDIDETEWQIIAKTFQKGLQDLTAFRTEEGKALQTDFEQRIAQIEQLLTNVEQIDKNRLNAVRERLQKAVNDLKETIDQNRFEQELIYYLEKYDITEEKVRLKNHLAYFKTTLSKPSNGKKLGFISQEIGREINTIGSKANDAELQKIVVQMKDELEKIKEQLLNVL